MKTVGVKEGAPAEWRPQPETRWNVRWWEEMGGKGRGKVGRWDENRRGKDGWGDFSACHINHFLQSFPCLGEISASHERTPSPGTGGKLRDRLLAYELLRFF
jgi:hypothetical protein